LFDKLQSAARWQLAALWGGRDGQVFEVVLAQPSGQPSRGALWPTVRLRTIVTAPTFDVSAVTVACRPGSNEGAEIEVMVEHQVPPCLCAGDDEVVLGPGGGLPLAGAIAAGCGSRASSSCISARARWAVLPRVEPLPDPFAARAQHPRGDLKPDLVAGLAEDGYS
jgi:hypothetical protein